MSNVVSIADYKRISVGKRDPTSNEEMIMRDAEERDVALSVCRLAQQAQQLTLVTEHLNAILRQFPATAQKERALETLGIAKEKLRALVEIDFSGALARGGNQPGD